MKRITCLALTLFVVATASGCSSTSSAKAEQAPQSVQADASGQTESKPIEASSTSSNEKVSATVEEQVLMEQDGIRVTLKSLESDSLMGPELKVLVENDGAKAVTVQIADASVNGIMVSPIFSCDVEPGKKANEGISFLSSEFEAAGISTIKDVEMKLNVRDPSTYEAVFTSEPISISTSADYVQKFDDSGSVALDRDGIKIVVKKLDSETSFWGADINVYIENNSDKDATIQIGETSVNGFMLEPIFSCDVLTGKKAFSSITFMESQLTENDITDITDLEFSFHVLNKNSYDTIFDSEKITIKF